MWVLIVRDGQAGAASIGDGAQYIAVLTGAVLAVTFWWVRHNVGIHNRKGPRKGRAAQAARIDVDRLGREIAWELPGGHIGALDASHLVLAMEDGRKVYRRGGHGD